MSVGGVKAVTLSTAAKAAVKCCYGFIRFEGFSIYELL